MTAQALAPPFLTSSEIDELCAPLKQRRAQSRRLCLLLGGVHCSIKRWRGFSIC